MILWLGFWSKHSKEKSAWVISWWITIIFSPVVYTAAAELDPSSSSFSLWMIKQRLWKQLWWRVWHFSLPECCCLSIEEEEDKSCSYQSRLRASAERLAWEGSSAPWHTAYYLYLSVYETQTRLHAVLLAPALHWSDFHQTETTQVSSTDKSGMSKKTVFATLHPKPQVSLHWGDLMWKLRFSFNKKKTEKYMTNTKDVIRPLMMQEEFLCH